MKAPYIAWYPQDFLHGIVGLSGFEIAVYSVALNLIYDQGAPIKRDDKRLARRCGMRVNQCTAAIDSLIDAGKIITADGMLSNPRAEKELQRRQEKITRLVGNLNSGKNTASVQGTSSKDNGTLETREHGEMLNGSKINGHAVPNRGPKNGVSRPETQTQTQNQIESARKAPAQPRAQRSARGTRLPDDWVLSPANMLFARQRSLTERETRREHDKFVAHYRAAPGDRGLSRDWDSTWQSWVMRTADRLGRDPTPESNGSAKSVGPEFYTRAEWERLISMWHGGASWNSRHGPEPGTPGSLVPPELIQ